MSDEDDVELFRLLKVALPLLHGADRTRADFIVNLPKHRQRMAGWQAEAREIINNHRAETDATARALGFGQITGGEL